MVEAVRTARPLREDVRQLLLLRHRTQHWWPRRRHPNGFTVPRRILRISEHGRSAPIARIALRLLRWLNPLLVGAFLKATRATALVLHHSLVTSGSVARRTSAGQPSSPGQSMMSPCSSGSRERESTPSCRTILGFSCLHFRRERLGANAWRCVLVVCALLGLAAAYGLGGAAGAPGRPSRRRRDRPAADRAPVEPPPPPATPAPIAFGVTVGGVRVRGLMPFQASKAVQKVYVKPLVLVVDAKRNERWRRDVGAQANVPKAIRRARVARPGAVVPLDVELSQARVRRYVERSAAASIVRRERPESSSTIEATCGQVGGWTEAEASCHGFARSGPPSR